MSASSSNRQSGNAVVHSTAMARVPAGLQETFMPLTARTALSAISSSKRPKSRVFQASTNERTMFLLVSRSVVMAAPHGRRTVRIMDAERRARVRELFRHSEHPVGMDDPSVSDSDLAVGARTGDLAALTGLLERYRPSLYAA